MIAASGGDWTTLAAFEGDHDGDTPSNGTNCQARVKGVPADSGIVYWNGWQSGQNATTRVVITAESGSETDGLTDGSGDDAVIEDRQFVHESTNNLYMDWLGLEFHVGNTNLHFTNDGGGEIRVAKCMFRDSTYQAIWTLGIGAACGYYIGGCLFKGLSNTYGAVRGGDADATVVIVNCTFADGARGISLGTGTFTAKNCAGVNNSNNDFVNVGTEITNLSETDGDLTDDDADDFTEPSSDDFRVYDTDSALYEAGTTESGGWFTTLCATDFAGTSWRATPAVGCFEYPSGATTHQGACTDGLGLSEVLAPTMTFSPVITDGFDLGEVNSKIATFPITLTDGIDLSDVLARSISALLSASDGVDIGDSNSITASFPVTVLDGLSFSDVISVIASYVALSIDGVTLSDLALGGSTIGATSVDGVTLTDSSSQIATLLASISETFNIGDSLSTILAYIVSISDIVDLSDNNTGESTLFSVSTDGFNIGDAATSLSKIIALALDGIDVGDTSALNATFVVESSDIVQFAEALAIVTKYATIVADGFTIGDSASYMDAAAEGNLVITFALKKANISFVLKRPDMALTLKKPGIDITLN
ncbi:MAG: hypothetical protein GY757_18790 [bacterium]|nr:hypothetical protein [bacterium]